MSSELPEVIPMSAYHGCIVRLHFAVNEVLLLAGYIGCIICLVEVLQGIANVRGSMYMGGTIRGWCCLVFSLYNSMC